MSIAMHLEESFSIFRLDFFFFYANFKAFLTFRGDISQIVKMEFGLNILAQYIKFCQLFKWSLSRYVATF